MRADIPNFIFVSTLIDTLFVLYFQEAKLLMYVYITENKLKTNVGHDLFAVSDTWASSPPVAAAAVPGGNSCHQIKPTGSKNYSSSISDLQWKHNLYAIHCMSKLGPQCEKTMTMKNRPY